MVGDGYVRQLFDDALSAIRCAPSLIEEGLTLTSAALSVQLYAVRDQLTEDLDGTLARLAAMGLQDVEAFDFVDRAQALAEGFESNGLRARTGHASRFPRVWGSTTRH